MCIKCCNVQSVKWRHWKNGDRNKSLKFTHFYFTFFWIFLYRTIYDKTRRGVKWNLYCVVIFFEPLSLVSVFIWSLQSFKILDENTFQWYFFGVKSVFVVNEMKSTKANILWKLTMETAPFLFRLHLFFTYTLQM